MRVVAARHMDRTAPLAEGPEPVAPAVVEHIDIQLVLGMVERKRPDDRAFENVERLVIGRDEDVDRGELPFIALKKLPLEPIPLGAAVDVAAHQDEEEHDLRKGEELDDEHEPDPIEIGAVVRIGKHGFCEAPEHVTQRDGSDERAGNGARPAPVARPVERAEEKKGDDD